MKIFYSFCLISICSYRIWAQWEIVDLSNCAYNAVYFVNDSVGFIVGSCGGNNISIKKTTNFGVNWTTVHSATNAWIYDIYFPSDSIGYASTYENVLKTIDGGETWFYPTPDFEGYPYRSIVFQDNDIGFGCFGNGGIAFAQTTDGGITWYEQSDFGGLILVKEDSCEIKMLGNGIWSSQDCASTWNLDPFDFADVSPIGFDFSAIDTSSIVCGIGLYDATWQNYGFIAKRNVLINTWDLQEFSYITKLNAIEIVNSSTNYCVGLAHNPNPFSFLKSIDGGITWGYQEYELPCDNCFSPNVRDVFCTSENVCYAISSGGAIWRTLNGGGELFPLPVSVAENEPEDELLLFPVPTDGLLQLNFPPVLARMTNIQVFDSMGQLVFTTNLNGSNAEIDVSHLAAGCYTLRANFESTVLTRSFMKN
jgi:photosystem II stability/assembly factor-like uncharacterized protein